MAPVAPHRTEFREATLTVSKEGVAEFTHRRPEARNALSPELKLDYGELLDRLSGDLSIRALILTGAGGSFCAGGNIKAMVSRLQSDDTDLSSPDYVRRGLDAAQRMLMQLRDLDIPVIAAVDGPAYGAGFGLALQADFLLASDRASFCMSFAKIGAVPDYGAAYTLPRIVGMARAKEIVLTARRIAAQEGVTLGFVHSVHAPDDLLPFARSMARRFTKGPREAFGLGKRMLNASFESDYASLASMEACAQAVCLNSAYHREAANRFVSRQPALYDWDAETD